MGYMAREQVEINPVELGVNAQSVNAAVTSSSFDVTGFNQLVVEIDYTYSAGTALTLYIETTDSLAGTPTWRRLQTQSISSGTSTLSNLLYSKTVSAADQNYSLEKPILHSGMRLVFAMTGAPDASDVVTARVRLGVV